MTTENKQAAVSASILHRLVLRLTFAIERLTERIELRNKRIALGVICHAQAWLRKMEYTREAECLDAAINEIARAAYADSSQNRTVDQPE